ncbi:MAG: peptidase M16 [Candidatus Binatia bacterium]|nr:MAG: peptidase M16 [Candidatus Binatia bacterium]
MTRRSTLSNGIRVLTHSIPNSPSVTLGIWVRNGSRFEEREQGGISHFLEHLIFKGTERRTARQIAQEIDAVGGILNAFTGKEYTCYYAKVLGEHLPVAQDLLADIFCHSTFPPEEIDRERSVVIQEILQNEDTPDDYVHDLFNLRFWPDHPLGWPICGSVETIRRLGREDFLRFFEARYRPDRVLLVAAGRVEHDRFHDWAERVFGALDGRSQIPPVFPPEPKSGISVVPRSLEQVHICMGLPAVAQAAPDRFAGYVLNTVLGGGMSSRLFQEIRERRGRAYSVYSFLSSYSDCGYLGIYVATSPEWVEEVIAVTRDELLRLATEKVPDDELERAKNQLKGNLFLALETSEHHMHRIARNEIYHGRDIPPSEVAACVEAVSSEDVLDFARSYVVLDRLAVTLLGDLEGRELKPDILTAA